MYTRMEPVTQNLFCNYLWISPAVKAKNMKEIRQFWAQFPFYSASAGSLKASIFVIYSTDQIYRLTKKKINKLKC